MHISNKLAIFRTKYFYFVNTYNNFNNFTYNDASPSSLAASQAKNNFAFFQEMAFQNVNNCLFKRTAIVK